MGMDTKLVYNRDKLDLIFAAKGKYRHIVDIWIYKEFISKSVVDFIEIMMYDSLNGVPDEKCYNDMYTNIIKQIMISKVSLVKMTYIEPIRDIGRVLFEIACTKYQISLELLNDYFEICNLVEEADRLVKYDMTYLSKLEKGKYYSDIFDLYHEATGETISSLSKDAAYIEADLDVVQNFDKTIVTRIPPYTDGICSMIVSYHNDSSKDINEKLRKIKEFSDANRRTITDYIRAFNNIFTIFDC